MAGSASVYSSQCLEGHAGRGEFGLAARSSSSSLSRSNHAKLPTFPSAAAATTESLLSESAPDALLPADSVSASDRDPPSAERCDSAICLRECAAPRRDCHRESSDPFRRRQFEHHPSKTSRRSWLVVRPTWVPKEDVGKCFRLSRPHLNLQEGADPFSWVLPLHGGIGRDAAPIPHRLGLQQSWLELWILARIATLPRRDADSVMNGHELPLSICPTQIFCLHPISRRSCLQVGEGIKSVYGQPRYWFSTVSI
jgi:hypothetical protein